MTTPILMPALSPTMETGKLVKWHVKEGDAVRAGDVIAEIETDKATMEVEAVDEGRIAKLLVAEGTEHVPVNQPIALLIEEGEDQPQAAAPPSPQRGEDAASRFREGAGEGAQTRSAGSQTPSPQPSPHRGLLRNSPVVILSEKTLGGGNGREADRATELCGSAFAQGGRLQRAA